MALEQERQRSPLNAREIAYALYQGRAQLERHERLEALLLQDPLFRNDMVYCLTRQQQYEKSLGMAARVEVVANQNQLSDDDREHLRLIFQGYTGCASSTTLHTLMFTKNLALLFTEPQQSKWMKLAKECRMIGCYVQTELGHGSNIRGLETTATFIPETDEFEIHSPTLTSIKWWPGALARTANFGVVYARLIIHGRDFGVHNFMVQLRDLDTHSAMPGITLGDIGPKIGFNSVDNGFCRFDHVRIPRENMAMRIATVDAHGKYEKNPDAPQALLYFTMLQTRLDFVRMTGLALAKACTIAIRYSAVRKQGFDASDRKGKGEEVTVLDYPSQQYRLLPHLAAAYAITLQGNQMTSFKQTLSREVLEGNMAMLNVGHAMSCGLKVLGSDLACHAIEQCRRACGGHGYLQSSGIPVLWGDIVQTVTAEGENYVLSLQTARALMKTLADFRSGTALPDNLSCFARIDIRRSTAQRRSVKAWLQSLEYLQAYEQRFLHYLKALEVKIANGSTSVGIQRRSIDCYKLSMAYSKMLLVQAFASAVASAQAFSTESISSPATIPVMQNMCHLFALSQLEQDAGEFMECGAMHPDDLSVVREVIDALLGQIRPHAVVLVDAFQFSDRCMNSTLGRYDGKVYEALYESTQHDPLNCADADRSAVDVFYTPIKEQLNSRL